MCNTFEIEWEELHIDKTTKGWTKRRGEVYLRRHKKNEPYSKLIISTDLVRESGWVSGDRVTIMKAKGISKMFAIRRQNEGNGKGELTLAKTSQQLCLNGQAVCLKVEWAVNGDSFDAWYDKDKDMVIFKPRKDN